MNDDKPIVIGFCGKAGVGKTSVANAFAPLGAIQNNTSNYGMIYDHLFFAIPLYELQSIKQIISGIYKEDRILYETHRVLGEILGTNPLFNNAPPYDKFVQLVKLIAALPIKDDGKDREFLQTAGSMCREVNQDAFVNWIKRKIYSTFHSLSVEDDDIYNNNGRYACIVSDVRMPNEAEFIANEPNGILIKFTASDEVRNERLYNRDGYLMTKEQLAHPSERVEDIDKSLIDVTIETDKLSLEEHVNVVGKIIREITGMEYSYGTSES